MAAARMTMAVSSTCLASGTPRLEPVAAKNGARLSMVAAVSARATMEVAPRASWMSSSSRGVAVVVRASELEEMSSVAVEEPAFDSAPADDFSGPGQFAAPSAGSKLYVGNLPWTCDSQQLAEVFQDVGEVELVEVIYDRETSRSRGFAFVTMASETDAMAAIEKLDGMEYGGRALKVNFPQANRERGTNNFSERPPRRDSGGFGGRRESSPSFDNANKLFVGNLAWSVDEVSLQQVFSDYGKVVDAKVVYDRDSGRSRGFGFVTFSQSSEVDAAIQNLDGADFDGRQLRVNLAGDKPPPRF